MSRQHRPSLALLGATAAFALTVLAAGPAVAADGASIDNAQPGSGAVKLLVSVPGTDTVDLDSVTVKVGGTEVDSEASPASSSEDVARTTILAIDTSESMAGARITEAQKAATAYLDTVPDNVKVGVVTFDDTVKVLVPAGLDRQPARDAVSSLKLTRNTALYDGVLGAIKAAGSGKDAGQRKILVLSDGKDTSKTPLSKVLTSIEAAEVAVDVVSLQQGDEGNQPLRDIATAGKGSVIDTQDPAALSAAFAQEAGDLARQVLVTAELPDGKDTSADVEVAMTAGGESYLAAAYVPIRSAAATEEKASGPIAVTTGRFAIPQTVMYGGVAAIGLGALAVVGLLGAGAPKQSRRNAITEQMAAYGAAASPGTAVLAAPQEMSIADQARLAAERALSNNRSLEARIAKRLDGAGMAMKPAEWLLLHGTIALLGALLGFAFKGVLLCLVLLAVGAVGPWIYLGLKRSKRLKAFNASLADTLQLMSGSLSAGLSLAQSVDTIVREGSEPITSEFKRVVIETRLGVTLEDSLEGVAERMESKDFTWVVMAIRIQREVGGNLAELLLTVAATLRERDYLRRHVRALSAEGRLSAYILGGLPPGFMLYLALSKPDYVEPMYTTPMGYIMLATMAILLSVGVFWMSKVAKVDL